MTGGRSGRSLDVILLAAAAIVVGMIVNALGEAAPLHVLHADPAHYLVMAGGGWGQGPEHPSAPFAWRVLAPWLVRATGLRPQDGFQLLTLCALAATPGLLLWFLSGCGVQRTSARAAAVALIVAPPLTGYLAWDYIRVDALALLLITASAGAFVHRRFVLFLALTAVLALTKETVLIPLAFAATYAACKRDPRSTAAALTAVVIATAVLATVRLHVPADGTGPLQSAFSMYWPLEPRTMLRRILLATAATWTTMLPVATAASVRMVGDASVRGLALALLAAVTVASAQIAVAFDTQRIVAAGYPFVLVLTGWYIGRVAVSPLRVTACWVFLVLLQIPWLLDYGRIAAVPGLRTAEICIVLLSLVAAGVERVHRTNRRPSTCHPPPSTMPTAAG